MARFDAKVVGGPLDGAIACRPVAPQDGEERYAYADLHRREVIYVYRFMLGVYCGPAWLHVATRRCDGGPRTIPPLFNYFAEDPNR